MLGMSNASFKGKMLTQESANTNVTAAYLASSGNEIPNWNGCWSLAVPTGPIRRASSQQSMAVWNRTVNKIDFSEIVNYCQHEGSRSIQPLMCTKSIRLIGPVVCEMSCTEIHEPPTPGTSKNPYKLLVWHKQGLAIVIQHCGPFLVLSLREN